jgi:hypothetical protein
MALENNEQKKPEFKSINRLTDKDAMPYGKWNGTPMANVPADYLLWMSDNNKLTPQVRAYVTDNWDGLCKEAGRPVKTSGMLATPRKRGLRR